MCTHPKFVLTGVICIEEALRGTEIVYVLTTNEVLLYVNQVELVAHISFD